MNNNIDHSWHPKLDKWQDWGIYLHLTTHRISGGIQVVCCWALVLAAVMHLGVLPVKIRKDKVKKLTVNIQMHHINGNIKLMVQYLFPRSCFKCVCVLSWHMLKVLCFCACTGDCVYKLWYNFSCQKMNSSDIPVPVLQLLPAIVSVLNTIMSQHTYDLLKEMWIFNRNKIVLSWLLAKALYYSWM